MSVSRRVLFAQLAGASLFAWRTSIARAQSGETVEYSYDVHGRVTRAEYSSGVVVEYEYDNAGNRTEVSRTGGATPPTPPLFSATINLSTATGPIDLRTVANGQGYDGLRNATITFVVGSAVTITGAAGGAGVNPGDGAGVVTGTWPSGSYDIALTLSVSGKVYGGGGLGGGGSVSGSPATAGNAGGDAVYAQENLTVLVNSGGQIKSGGGGGGGGGAWILTVGGEPTHWYGGDGGGGFPNGPSGGGSAGTSSGGGAGGAGESMPFGRTNGAGGAGGNAGASGVAGAQPSGTSFPNLDWSEAAYASGGAPGYAIRKNGKTVSVTNNGTITGTVG